MEIMSDILQNPLLDAAAISEERDIITNESENIRQQPGTAIWDHLHETAFMGTGLSRSVRGPEQNIRSLTSQDLNAFKSAQYSADRFVIAAAGAVDHTELVALTEKHFGKLPTLPTGSMVVAYDPAIFTGSDKRIRYDSMGVRHTYHITACIRNTAFVVYITILTIRIVIRLDWIVEDWPDLILSFSTVHPACCP